VSIKVEILYLAEFLTNEIEEGRLSLEDLGYKIAIIINNGGDCSYFKKLMNSKIKYQEHLKYGGGHLSDAEIVIGSISILFRQLDLKYKGLRPCSKSKLIEKIINEDNKDLIEVREVDSIAGIFANKKSLAKKSIMFRAVASCTRENTEISFRVMYPSMSAIINNIQRITLTEKERTC